MGMSLQVTAHPEKEISVYTKSHAASTDKKKN